MAVLTMQKVADEAAPLFANQTSLVMNCTRTLSKELMSKKRIGTSIDITIPAEFQATEGVDDSSDDKTVTEGSYRVTLDRWIKVVKNISVVDLSLNMKNFNEQWNEPAMKEMAQKADAIVAEIIETIPNQVGVPGNVPTTIDDASLPKVMLDEMGVPAKPRVAIYNSKAATKLAVALATVFPEDIATAAIEEAHVKRYAGFTYFMNQEIINHTNGNFVGAPLIDGAGQNVTYNPVKDQWEQTLNLKGFTPTVATVKKGDRFTINNTLSLNRANRKVNADLRNFVILEDATADAGGLMSLRVTPPIITKGAAVVDDPYSTVNNTPADGETVNFISGTPGQVVPQNMAFNKKGLFFTTAKLEPLPGNVDSATKVMPENNIALLVTTYTNGSLMESTIRWDMLVSVDAVRPDYICSHVG